MNRAKEYNHNEEKQNAKKSFLGFLSVKKIILFTLIILLFNINSMAVQDDTPSTSMKTIKKDFLDPPRETRPGIYWYWINDNISKAFMIFILYSSRITHYTFYGY